MNGFKTNIIENVFMLSTMYQFPYISHESVSEVPHTLVLTIMKISLLLNNM